MALSEELIRLVEAGLERGLPPCFPREAKNP
jgi:hypothetical protein